MIVSRRIMLVLAFIGVVGTNQSFSQKKAENVQSQWASKTITADGEFSDWPDSLKLYNDGSKLHYSIANDNENLYLALRTAGKEDVQKILTAGVSFSPNIDVKKKVNPTITFPVLDRTPGKPKSRDEDPEPEVVQKEVLARIKDLRVEGFKEIIDGAISLQNTYGIRAAASYDKDGNLLQEIVLPLRLLGLSPGSTEVPCLIKVNGLQGRFVAMQQRQRANARGIGSVYSTQTPPKNHPAYKIFATTEFYIKVNLSTKP